MLLLLLFTTLSSISLLLLLLLLLVVVVSSLSSDVRSLLCTALLPCIYLRSVNEVIHFLSVTTAALVASAAAAAGVCSASVRSVMLHQWEDSACLSISSFIQSLLYSSHLRPV